MESNLKTLLLAIAAGLTLIAVAIGVYVASFDAPPPPAPTATITASPESIEAGQSSDLTWSTTNADTVTLDSVSVATSGTQSVGPAATTTYTLSATGPGGTVEAQATVTVTQPPPPSGDYDVGPGQTLATLGEVPWSTLAPGSEVRIHYRPEPYREFIAVSARGTAAERIRIIGVPGPNGEQPVVSGQNAVAHSQFATFPQFTTFNSLALVLVHNSFGATVPGYITIEGLTFEAATSNQSPATFTRPDGTSGTWNAHATGIYLSTFDSVEVKNCTVRNCGNGIFTHDGRPCSDLLIENCDVSGNGTIGSYLTHNLYIQCVRPIYRNNRLGRLRSGAGGGNLKDRSADVLIEGNVIEGGARNIDLSGWQNETAERAGAPNAARSIVRNNVVINRNGDAVDLIYSETRTATNGDHFVCDVTNNTFVIRRDQSNAFYLRVMRSEYDDNATFNFGGNLLDRLPAASSTPPSIRVFDSRGTLNLTANWTRDAVSNYSATTNTINGWETWVTAGVAPGFVDESNGDFHLITGAAATGFGIQ